VTHVDVLLIGAGLSGVGAACHLTRALPGTSYLLLEARDTMGGTWDLFRYPGVRSDSDMFTLGYRFRPWTEQKAIADGPSILRYVRDTAAAHGVDRRVRYGTRVERAEWSSDDATWTVHATRDGEPVTYTCGFLWCCSGYYRYDEGFSPSSSGIQLASGRELGADVVVTATGLNLLVFGGLQLVVDGHDVHLPDTMAYRGAMLSGVPNFASRYVQRSLHLLPKQGSRAPWRLRQNYLRDVVTLRRARFDDLRFSRAPARERSSA